VIRIISKDAGGQGVAEVIFALRRNAAKIPARTVVAKAVASAFTIGTGGSAGPEGPIIQIGGGVGSIVGRALKVSPQLLRVVVAGGAAAGLAAVFNAPIGGVLFAMEVLLRDFVVDAFSLVVLSSVSGAVTAHLLLGDKTFLQTPSFALNFNSELILFGALGVLTGIVCHYFVRTIHLVERTFDRSFLPEFWRPAVGGLLVGVFGWLLPPVMGPGIRFMTSVVRGGVEFSHWAPLMFILLLAGKIVATSLTLGSGGSGGLLTPSFFCGATTGAFFGIACSWVFPSIGGYGSYALVGMAAFFAALSRAPLTAIIILFELTHDPRVILPAMVACVLSTGAAQRLGVHSFELLRLLKKGFPIDELDSRDPLSALDVGSVMARDVVVLTQDMTLEQFKQKLAETRHTGYPVLSPGGELAGLVSDAELYAAVNSVSDPNQLTVGSIMRTDIRTATVDMSLRQAIRLMSDSGQDRLPVVESPNSRRLVGLVSRSHLLGAYRSAGQSAAIQAKV
jgi:CIC family chloride channel protein